ncbi:MAG: NUDIX domain-containing protein [Cytophagales bacterium]
MKILVNKVQIEITKDHQDLDRFEYETIYDAKKDKDIFEFLEYESALIIRPSDKLVSKIFETLLETDEDLKIKKLTFVVFKPKLFKESFKKRYQLQALAGGLVQRGNKFLLVYENNKWALPKGRIDAGEQLKEAAKREVEEESSISVNVLFKLGSTYKINAKNKTTLRRYHWFLMETQDRTKLKPSMLEGIKDAKWHTRSEIGRLHAELDWYVEEVLKKYDRFLLKKMRLDTNED